MFTKAEAIESFLAKYKVPRAAPAREQHEQGDGEEYKFEYKYPKLLSSLRLVEAFGADSVSDCAPRRRRANNPAVTWAPKRGVTYGGVTYKRVLPPCS